MEPMERRRNAYWALMWKLNERDHLEDIGVGERITLKYILNKCCGMAGAGFIWPRIGASGGIF